MPNRKPGAKGTTKVTFSLPREVKAHEVSLCGDFNDWSPAAHPLKKYKDGHFAVSVNLPSGVYRYRFLIDGLRWENDWQAEEYAANDYGSEDSVIRV
ncbi:MAG: isoamylase early set domain-containing protein [Acidimicrobiales bacterium]|nr:isoamylase early set domain-containing protein [Acidimicrobiales bacterium]